MGNNWLPPADVAANFDTLIERLGELEMSGLSNSVHLVIADDDEDDRMLIEDAFVECCLNNHREYVEDGEELLQYLRGEGKWSDRDASKLPGLILLDLNMPRMDGRTALSHLKDDPKLKRIPVIVLTTSKAEEDILRTYDLGVSSFISKPVSFDGLIKVVRALNNYWIELVQLPARADSY